LASLPCFVRDIGNLAFLIGELPIRHQEDRADAPEDADMGLILTPIVWELELRSAIGPSPSGLALAGGVLDTCKG
jgi:hypothetical protein